MKRAASYLFLGAVGLGIIGFFYLTYLQYVVWRDGGQLTRYLVPPYQSVWYVVGYVIGHQAYSYIVSLGVSFIFLGLAFLLNEKFRQRFFEADEPYWGALGIFILGNPWWFCYLAAVLLIAVIGSLVISYQSKKSERFSLYYLWLPVAAVILIISKTLF